MKKGIYHIKLIGTDFLTAVVAWIIFYNFRKVLLQEAPEVFKLQLFINATIIGFFWVLLYQFFGFYHDIYQKSRIKEALSLLSVSVLGTLIIFFVLLIDDIGIKNYIDYYYTFGSYFGIHYLLSFILKFIVITEFKIKIKNKKVFFNTLIIGSGPKALELYDELQNSYDHLGLNFLAYLNIRKNNNGFGDQLRCLGDISRLSKIIRRCHIEQVIIAVEKDEYDALVDVMFELEKNKEIKISIMSDVHQLLIGSLRVKQSFDVPLLDINQDLLPTWQQKMKRLSDIVVSLLVLTIGFPFFLFIALLIKLNSKGSVLYRQERVGLFGKTFSILKFRSMFVDAEKSGPALSQDKDDRITPVGKFLRKTRIDEFPQFWNVLIGDMSLVGPRPERQFFIDQIIKLAPYYRHLHKIRPGITSLGQVKFGYASNVDEMIKRLKYDIMYIENMSFIMDVRILLYTVMVMIQGRGK